MRFFTLSLLCLATACSAPSPAMRGAISTDINVDHSRFTVHRLADQAEAVRTSFEPPGRLRGVMHRGYIAIERATGCRIIRGSFDGDPALMRARLNCAWAPDAQENAQYLVDNPRPVSR